MAVLDAIQIFLVPDRTHKDHDDFAGKTLKVTLEYISQSKGVEACYVSKQAVGQEIWIFLVHKDIQTHEHFLESTIGVGIMLPFLQSPPRLYSFSEDPFDFLSDNTNLQLSLYEFDPKPSGADMAKFEQALQDLWSPHTVFFAPQSDEGSAAFLGLTTETKSLRSAARNQSINAPQYTVQSQIIGVDLFVPKLTSGTSLLPLPTTTGELLRSDPRSYGDIPFNESAIGTMAQTQSISFRPMEYIADSDWFTRDENDSSLNDSYEKCISITTLRYAQARRDEDACDLQETFRELSIQPGLLSLHWFKNEHDPRIVRIIAAWTQETGHTKFQSIIKSKIFSQRDSTYAQSDPEFAAFPAQGLPDWDDGSLIELVTFDFPKSLSNYEKTAFEWYLNKFIANMEPSDPDEPSIVQPFKPLWSSSKDKQQSVVFISWNGLPERKAWLQNFLAHPYDVAGYVVHGVFLSGAAIVSTTETLHTVDHFKLKYKKESVVHAVDEEKTKA
ncbi:uncharacterized protein N0V89_010858 [Didymosphaeria variabile]|uniref:ABM domain-containing protein n=1 Tax=Didymosphaeria variabile TaxID=1932322 RepID=A0A9W9C5W7_9PLEO|nr:uncharacterized protein N0V89_010858 [Didymosphaeria variabile]KAJ4346925.1 hypothetical protein N0V89_010858 [Didymosphaeria variabile]